MKLTTDIGGALNALDNLNQMLTEVDGYSAAVVNNVSYAAAVEDGYTVERYWADMTREQRYAIIMSAKEGKGKTKRDDIEYEKVEGGFKFHVPGVGMVSASISEIASFMSNQAESLNLNGQGNPFTRLVDETALYALVPISEKTPVDKSDLLKGWNVIPGGSVQ